MLITSVVYVTKGSKVSEDRSQTGLCDITSPLPCRHRLGDEKSHWRPTKRTSMGTDSSMGTATLRMTSPYFHTPRKASRRRQIELIGQQEVWDSKSIPASPR